MQDRLNPPRVDEEDEMSVITKLAASEIYTTEPIAQFSLQLRPQFWWEFVSVPGVCPPTANQC